MAEVALELCHHALEGWHDTGSAQGLGMQRAAADNETARIASSRCTFVAPARIPSC